MKKLDIIIPHYKEPFETLRPLLDSIEGQIGLNKDIIQVTIVNDGPDADVFATDSIFMYYYNFDIKVYTTPDNGGPGMARQFGINSTTAPYIMFCDSDDRFYSVDALLNLLTAAEQCTKEGKWSYIWSYFYEERHNDKEYSLIPHTQPSMVWLHGKIWNRAFLDNFKIHFLYGLRTYEDTYFGRIAGQINPSLIKKCEHFTYLWRDNKDSITNKWNHDDRDYLYWNNGDYIMAMEGTINFFGEGTRYLHIKNWNEIVYTTIFFNYYMLQLEEFSDLDNPETKQKYDNIIQMTQRILKNHAEKLTASEELRSNWFFTTFVEMRQFRIPVDIMPWSQWIDKYCAEWKDKLEIKK